MTATKFETRMGPLSERGTPRVFPPTPAGDRWSDLVDRTGCGSFLGGFVRLFTEDLQAFDPCVAAWSFLFEHECERWVIGKNAHGALLVLEEPTRSDSVGRVGMLDPLQVRYATNPDLHFESLIERWLPEDRLPGFLDDTLFRAIAAAAGEPLPPEMILGLSKPLSLGGSLTADNVRPEPLLDYYATTGPIYRRALEQLDQTEAKEAAEPAKAPSARAPAAQDPEIAERIEAAGDPNAPLASGRLPLRHALELGALKQAKKLLKLGADPRRPGDDGRSSLEAAVESGHAEFVRRFRNAARALSREDGAPGVRFVDTVDGTEPLHVVAIRKGIDQVASGLKTHRGWKPNRRAAGSVVLLQQSQAFLLARGSWSLLLFHATTDERREIEQSSSEVQLSMKLGSLVGIRDGKASTFAGGYAKAEHLGDDATAFLAEQGIQIPPYRFETDGVTLTLELAGGLQLADVEPVIEFPIRPL